MAASAPFRLGTKEVHLPDFTVILRRTKHNAPTHASFVVPLWFSKLDLRDYLWNAYNVPVLGIRSYVQQSRIEQGKDRLQGRPQYKRWHRPRSTKRMTVQLERPFEWPAEPEDFKPWNMEEVKMAEEEQDAFQERLGPSKDQLSVPERHREKLREQAKALLEGKVKWKPAGDYGVGSLKSR